MAGPPQLPRSTYSGVASNAQGRLEPLLNENRMLAIVGVAVLARSRHACSKPSRNRGGVGALAVVVALERRGRLDGERVSGDVGVCAFHPPPPKKKHNPPTRNYGWDANNASSNRTGKPISSGIRCKISSTHSMS